MLRVVAARSTNGVIGRSGALPWRLPTDLRRFRQLTMGGVVLMGRKTFESLPASVRPLPGRRNLVLTSDRAYYPDGVEIHRCFRSALDATGSNCFVIGGERVFHIALPFADRLYLTDVDIICEGDAFFPHLGPRWTCVEESEPVVENGLRFVFRVYE